MRFSGSTWLEVQRVTAEVSGQLYVTEGIMDYLATGFYSPELYAVVYQDAVADLAEKYLGKGNTSPDVEGCLWAIYGLIVGNLDLDCWTDVEAFSGLVMLLTGLIHEKHYAELCLAWMNSLSGGTEFASSKYRRVFINCPVDVSVYDSDGALVARVEDRTIQEIENGVAVFIDNNEQIIVSLPVTDEYTVELTATDAGTVTYTVAEHDVETGNDERVVSYIEMDVEDGDVLVGTIDNLEETSEANYSLTLNDEVIEADVDQNGEDVEEYMISCSVEGDGEVTGGGIFTIGEYCKVAAMAEEGAEFLGWYNESDELVTTDLEYRFCVKADVTLVAKFTVASILGDVNGDGNITATDARWLLQYLSGAREKLVQHFGQKTRK